MIKKISILAVAIVLIALANSSFTTPTTSEDFLDVNEDTPIWDIFEQLGKIRLNEVNQEIEGVSAEKGRNLVLKGYSAKQDGSGKTSMQSAHFRCTACHNPEKAYANLADIKAQSRLDYAVEKDMPFLQGSSFYGIVNRETFYNDDYQKKYQGVPLIKESYRDIRAAIQLCATQCAQGRALEDWEIESVLAFFWTKQLRIKDLGITKDEQEKIETVVNNDSDGAQAIHLLEEHYMNKAPAQFAESMDYTSLSADQLNDKESFANGKEVYDRGCLHCHAKQRYSFFNLDNSRYSFKYLLKRTKQDGKHSVYNITRHGTYSLKGKKAYMPQYPLEKMSNEQLTDLMVYIENMAAGKNLLE